MLDETNRLIAVASMFAMGCCRCSGKAHDGTVACASGWVRKRDEVTSEETARPVLRGTTDVPCRQEHFRL